MPRVSSDDDGFGRVVIPGVYARLREREQLRHRYPVVFAEPGNPAAGYFRRPTHLLDALTAGEPVTLPRSSVVALFWTGRGSPPVVPWPAEVAPWLTVTADDVVTVA